MEQIEQIEHKGIIKEITSDNRLLVSILATSGCASCSVKGACNVSDIEEKIVEIRNFSGNIYKLGQRVDVFYKQSLGFRALFLGYVLPFIIMMSVLIISMSITGSEGFSGLLSILVLAPYYLILYLSRKKIKETFSFSIK